MKHYAYRLYKHGNLNQPKYAGTASANSMDDAVKNVIKRHNICVGTEVRYFQEYLTFYLDDEKVGIIIYANPEDHMEK